MQPIPQTGVALYNSQIEASQEVATAMFQSIEKAEKLILDAARQNFEQQIRFAQALAAARDPEGVAALQGVVFGHNPKRAQEYQEQVLKIIMEANAAYGHAFNTYLQGVKQSTGGAEAKPAAAAKPDGLAGGFFPMWEAAFKEFSKNASQLMQTAGNGMAPKTAAPAKTRSAGTR
jgi:hypothetical protein